ncbi:MAG: hypothetical protein Q9180_007555 [Flavoplaca navasiana]
MVDVTELTDRQDEEPLPTTSSSDLSSGGENNEIRQAINEIILELNPNGTSQSNKAANGESSDAVGGINRTEEQDNMEIPHKTIKATDKAVNSVPGMQGSTLVPYVQGKAQTAPVSSESLSRLPSRPFHAGLGTLSILPPEIRLQIWELVVPITDFCIHLKPEQEPNIDPVPARKMNTLGLFGTSKQIHDEIKTHFFHGRSLAIIFTTTRDPSARRVNIEKAQLSNPGLILDGVYSASVHQFRHFAEFASIKLFIELPKAQMAGHCSFRDLCESIGCFADTYFTWQINSRQKDPRWHMEVPPLSSPRIEIMTYNRMYPDDMEKGEPSFELNLEQLALLLDPLRNIVNAGGATVEVNHQFRYGMEWLPELLSHVSDDMQNDRLSWCGQWRQKNMQCALFQSELFTQATLGHESGGPLPIGMPEELAEDHVEYITDITGKYDLADYQVFLDTGELPYRPPGRPIKVATDDTDFLGSQTRLGTFPKPPNIWDNDSSDMIPIPSNTERLDRQRSRDVLPKQSGPFLSNATESQAEQHSPTEAPALKNPPSVESDTTPSTSVVAQEDKQEVDMSCTVQAKGATKGNIPDAAKFTDLEMALMGILLSIVMFWLHKVI